MTIVSNAALSAEDAVAGPASTTSLGYEPPYRFADMLAFYGARSLEGVELVTDSAYMRTARLASPSGEEVHGWLRVEDDRAKHCLVVTVSESLVPCAAQVVARVRRQFDVDCRPRVVAEGIASLEDVVPGAVRLGVRLPGCFEPFETACRAVLGQQVSVKAANKLAARIVQAYGAKLETGVEELTHAFPSPVEVLALEPLEEAFGQLGVIRSRSRTIAELARLVQAGELDFDAGASASEQMKRLLAVKGIGPWSANYIAMRTMSHPDAFLETDAGVAHALPDLSPKERLALAEEWRPWRSYAVLSLWNSLAE